MMTYSEIKNQAFESYPPTKVVLESVISDIDRPGNVARRLRVNYRTFRRWMHGDLVIPRIYWAMLLLEREFGEQEGLSYVFVNGQKYVSVPGNCRYGNGTDECQFYTGGLNCGENATICAACDRPDNTDVVWKKA